MDHFASYDVCVSTAFMTSSATKLNSWYARPLVYHHLVPVWHLRRLLRQGSVFVGPRGGTRRRRCRELHTVYMLVLTCYELHGTAQRGRSPLTDARLYSRIHYIRMHYWTLLLIQHSSNDFPPLRITEVTEHIQTHIRRHNSTFPHTSQHTSSALPDEILLTLEPWNISPSLTLPKWLSRRGCGDRHIPSAVNSPNGIFVILSSASISAMR